MLSLLKGVRVLDLTTVVLGPYATQILADLGAEVIKVEPLSGDVFRSVRPGHSKELGAGFLNTNRNKRSIAIDLQSEDGRATFLALARKADVVVHNMRSKSVRKLGVDFDSLKAVNDRIIYCFAAGFDQSGPKADEPAYDDTIQAASGLAYLNSNVQGEPRFLPTIVADKVGGLHLALAVLAGLSSADRGKKAICIEAPMFESLVSFLLVEQMAGRTFSPPLGGIGYDRLLSPYRKPFPTSDGFLSIIPYTSAHWTRFLRLVGREDMMQDPRVLDPVQRSRNIDFLYTIIEDSTPSRSTDEWVRLLRENDIPHARVNRAEDLFDDAHLREIGFFREIEHPTEGKLVSVRSPFTMPHDERAAPDRPAPVLGQDTLSILSEAGFDDAAIADLVARGTIGAAASAGEKA